MTSYWITARPYAAFSTMIKVVRLIHLDYGRRPYLRKYMIRSSATWTRKKKGPTEKRLSRLADCIERGLKHVRAEQEAIREYIADIKNIAETLEPENARCEERKGRFETLIDQFRETEDPIRLQMAKVMPSFQSGLFSGKTPLPRFATISISNAGFACQKAIRARFTAGVMLACGWSKTGRHWSWHSMPMRPIRNTFGGITNAIARL